MIANVDVWTFIWLMFLLKIPIVALFLIVRWAVEQTPEAAPGEDGGIGPRPRRATRTARARAGRARRAAGPHGEPPPRRRRACARSSRARACRSAEPARPRARPAHGARRRGNAPAR